MSYNASAVLFYGITFNEPFNKVLESSTADWVKLLAEFYDYLGQPDPKAEAELYYQTYPRPPISLIELRMQHRFGVNLVSLGTEANPDWALSIARTRLVVEGDPLPVRPDYLGENKHRVEWDRQLANALDYLGLSPTAHRGSRWWLATWYG